MLDYEEKIRNGETSGNTNIDNNLPIPDVELGHTKIQELERELLYVTSQYELMKRERDYYQRKLSYIEQSRSWRLTYPVRKILDFVKQVFSFGKKGYTKKKNSHRKENLVLSMETEELLNYPVIADDVAGSSFFQIRLFSPANSRCK
ncbi:MAG: hypothetical protein LRY73_19385 [Bacillus sp. (in: Bacteria)]|nr:hypothetical protein [Bacillus sp. (in: firmicutes)]